MKTTLFYTLSREPELAKNIMRDIIVLFTLDEAKRKVCMLGLLEIADDTMTQKQRSDTIERIAKANDIDLLKALSSFQVLQFLLKKLDDDNFKKATTPELAEDFPVCCEQVDLEIDRDVAIPVFKEVIEYLRSDEILQKYTKINDKKLATSGVLPSITSFGTTVELRAVVGNPFRIGMVADENYDPDIKDIAPVVSILLRADSGVVDEFSFQVSEAELEALIQELHSAQISIRKLQELVTFQNSAATDGKEECSK